MTRAWVIVASDGRFAGIGAFFTKQSALDEAEAIDEELSAQGRLRAGGGPHRVVPCTVSVSDDAPPVGRTPRVNRPSLVVLPGGKGRRQNPSEGEKLYTRLHWGDAGRRHVSRLMAPDPSAGPIVQLGQLREIGYLTSKHGDPRSTIYEHTFKRPFPHLCVNGEGGLVIVGGGYSVEERGIVG